MVPKWAARGVLAYLLILAGANVIARAQMPQQEAVAIEGRLSRVETTVAANDKRLERIENLLLGLVITTIGHWITTEWRLRQRRRNDDDDDPPLRPRRRGHRQVLDLSDE
jgi:hypothetical protein